MKSKIKKNNNKKNIIKSLIIIFTYLALMVAIMLILKALKLDNIETLKQICNNSVIGALVFIFLQILQVVFLPLNSLVFTIPAIIIFGPVKAFFISFVGIVLGSIIMFFIGRFGGVKVLSLLCGKNKAEHYAKALGKTKFLFPIFMLLAFFPDDILCVSAGLSNFKFSYFLCVVLITRAIDLASTCFIGTFIVQSKIGIIILSVFLVIALVVAIILTKKQDKVENWFVKAFSKQKIK